MKKLIVALTTCMLIVSAGAYAACDYPRDFDRGKYYNITLQNGQSYYGKVYKARGNCWVEFQIGKNKKIKFKFDQVSTYSQAEKKRWKN